MPTITKDSTSIPYSDFEFEGIYFLHFVLNGMHYWAGPKREPDGDVVFMFKQKQVNGTILFYSYLDNTPRDMRYSSQYPYYAFLQLKQALVSGRYREDLKKVLMQTANAFDLIDKAIKFV